MTEVFHWLEHPYIDAANKQEIRDILHDEEALTERFSRFIDFGTGGLRALLGAGTSRMNAYTVRWVSQAFAKEVWEHKETDITPCLIVAYDVRHGSAIMAQVASQVFLEQGLDVLLFSFAVPTPLLSYAIRHHKASGGIVITASHNPKSYNGYKIYNAQGVQLVPKQALLIQKRMKEQTFAESLRPGVPTKKQAQLLGSEEIQAYIQDVRLLLKEKKVIPENKAVAGRLKVVYTPLHGTGRRVAQALFSSLGFVEAYEVASQSDDHPDFPTVKTPNPEDKEVFQRAIVLAEQVDADLIFATDPDADRLGVMAKKQHGQYQYLGGNACGALMLATLLQKQAVVGPGDVVLQTVVTSELGASVARYLGASVEYTLTGFKYIGQKMETYDNIKQKQVVFGYEESGGYLWGHLTRDKDAILAMGLMLGLAYDLGKKGKTVWDALANWESRCGVHLEKSWSVALSDVRPEQIASLADVSFVLDSLSRVVRIEDYARHMAFVRDNMTHHEEALDFPYEALIKWIYDDGSWIAVRPSGTEPKIKMYLGSVAADKKAASKRLKQLEADLLMVSRAKNVPFLVDQ